MIISDIAKRYAKALFDIAAEEKSLPEIQGEIDEFAQILRAHKELKDIFENPVIKIDDKKTVVERVIAAIKPSIITGNFIRLLVDKDRMSILDQICLCYQKYLDDAMGRLRVGVSTAFPLSNDLSEHLQQELTKVTKKNVQLDIEEDPSLLGGIIVTVGDTRYDGSVRNQLNSIRELIREEM